MIGWRKSSLLRQPITLPDSCFRFASREQIRLVENGLKARLIYRKEEEEEEKFYDALEHQEWEEKFYDALEHQEWEGYLRDFPK